MTLVESQHTSAAASVMSTAAPSAARSTRTDRSVASPATPVSAGMPAPGDARHRLLPRPLMLMAGLGANALGVAVITKAELGTTPLAAIPYGLSLVLPHLTLGQWTIVFGLALTVVQLMVDPTPVRWGQVGVQTVLGIVFGSAIDLCMALLTHVSLHGYLQALALLLLGCLVIAVGAYLEVVANIVMLPGDAFVRAVSRRAHVRFGRVRVVSDVSMSLIGAAISWIFLHSAGSVREGTLISAIVVGLTVNRLDALRERWARHSPRRNHAIGSDGRVRAPQ